MLGMFWINLYIRCWLWHWKIIISDGIDVIQIHLSEIRNGEVIYSPDDLAVGRLMVDMDRIGFGPKDGFDPEDLRHIAEFVKKYVVTAFQKYYQNHLEKLTSKEYVERASQFHEVISLFFYHLYRKYVRDSTRSLLDSNMKAGE